MRQQWQTAMNKKLYQIRIDGNLKELIRILSILDRTSITDVTEKAFRYHINSSPTRLRQYYLDKSKGV